MNNIKEYCVVAVHRSKYGNKYKELYRGTRKNCHKFRDTYGKQFNGKWQIKVGIVMHDLVVKEVKDDNSIYNTIDVNDYFDKPFWDEILALGNINDMSQ